MYSSYFSTISRATSYAHFDVLAEAHQDGSPPLCAS